MIPSTSKIECKLDSEKQSVPKFPNDDNNNDDTTTTCARGLTFGIAFKHSKTLEIS